MIIFYFRCVDWHPHKGIVVSGSKDNQQPIKLWDPKSGQVWHCGSIMDAICGTSMDAISTLLFPRF